MTRGNHTRVTERRKPGERVHIITDSPAAMVSFREAGARVHPFGDTATLDEGLLKDLVGARVVLLPNNHQESRLRTEHVAKQLEPFAAEVGVATSPNASPDEDAGDFLRLHPEALKGPGTLAQFVQPLAVWRKSHSAELETRDDGSEKAGAGRSQQQPGQDITLKPLKRWEQPVSGVTLADELLATLRRFIVLPIHQYVAVALWILFAHAVDAFQVAPLLVAKSPAKRCGKSTLLSLVSALVPRAVMTSSLTTAVLFRMIDKYRPTLLIDEADTFLKFNEEMRGALNAGHLRGGTFHRTSGDNHELRAFDVFGAKMIALIGQLPDTLEDRAVIVPMVRRAPGDHVERLRLDRLKELGPVGSRAARWAEDHLEALRNADPTVPDELNDRAQDNWRPLLTIADQIGGDWPAKARQAALMLSGASSSADDVGERLLADMRELLFEQGLPEQVPSEAVVAWLTAREGSPWPEWRDGRPLTKSGLARLLRRFGIEPRTIRADGGRVVRGYIAADFQDAFDRYACARVLQPLQDAPIAGESPISQVLQETPGAVSQSEVELRHERLVASAAPSQGGKGDIEVEDDFDRAIVQTEAELVRDAQRLSQEGGAW